MRRALSLLAVLTTAVVAVVHVPTAAASTSVGFEPPQPRYPAVKATRVKATTTA